MASRILRKINVKQMALGAIALSAVLVMPKIGDTVSKAYATVRAKIGGTAV